MKGKKTIIYVEKEYLIIKKIMYSLKHQNDK